MKKVLLGIVIGVFALHAYQRVHDPEPACSMRETVVPELKARVIASPP
jgi:hypothetical protein